MSTRKPHTNIRLIRDLSFIRAANPYRTGGAEAPMAQVLERLTAGTNELIVGLG
jgi:hypothetical protein